MAPTVEVPESVPDVVGALAGQGTVVLAGGTVVMPAVNTTAHDVGALVSLRRAGLRGIEVDGARAVIGAATTLSDVGRDERLAVLRPVIESIASPTIRNLATVGGNLFVHQPYGDLAVALLALDAEVDVAGEGGGTATRPVADVLRDGVGSHEVVTAVAFDVPETAAWRYTKAMRRKQNSASIVTVAAVLDLDGGTVTAARIALGGAGARPVRATAAEQALAGGPLDHDRATAAGAAAVHDAEPFDDAYASAWYRGRVLGVHVRRALLGEE
jgi:CO/xanthine dehydrogenase FAD-binding subunit